MSEIELFQIPSGSLTIEGKFVDEQRAKTLDLFFENSEYVKSVNIKTILSVYLSGFNLLNKDDVMEFISRNMSLTDLLTYYNSLFPSVINGEFDISLELYRYDDSDREVLFINVYLDDQKNDLLAFNDSIIDSILNYFPSLSERINLSLYPKT